MRPRHVAAIAVVLALTVAGFIVARVLASNDAQHDSQHRLDVAAAQIRSRIAQAASLTESLGRYMSDASGIGVTDDQFARNVLRWLRPSDLPAAAWAENVPDADRAAYERRTGEPIVGPGAQREKAPLASSYFPATLVSGFAPLNLRGVDLKREPGVAAALAQGLQTGAVRATPVAARTDGTRGLFLVASASNLINGRLHPGAAVLFVSEPALRSATNVAGLRFPGADRAPGDRGRTVRDEFTVAEQRFAVEMPREAISGPGVALPWLILAAGLVLAALVGALGINSARRVKAQADYDRLFNLSPDVIAVADFDGHFTRVNPAVETVLGYTEEEFIARPYLDLVHPDDRARTVAQASAIGEGKPTLSFENRYVRKDGSYRVLEWTSTPVVQDRLMYGVARDVTERREAEAEAKRLADEQAALRRVATLVAQGVPSAELFNTVSEAVGGLFGSDMAAVARYEADGRASVVVGLAQRVEGIALGSRWELVDGMAATRVYRTGRSARADVDWPSIDPDIAAAAGDLRVASSVAAPIVVEGELWGTISVAARAGLPSDTEERLEKFTALVATAIANAQARSELSELATEQGALRNVATMVARGRPAEEVFATVAEEVALLLGLEVATVRRLESDGWSTIVARWGELGDAYRVGARVTPEGEARDLELRAAVASPIVVNGRVWGAITAGTSRPEPLRADAESRIANFTELVATAISNVQARSDLAASRTRLVAAADDERRRLVRDLHDGAQQRLVSAIVTLKLAQQVLQGSDDPVAPLVDDALEHATQGNAELRELAHGILPTVLTRGGLRAGVHSFVDRLDLPIDVDVPVGRFPAEIEASAYFIVAEALTNVVKHARAGRAEVRASLDDGTLCVEIRDDGIGGADPEGHGLVGIGDRVTALGGRLDIDSPPGGGTRLAATLPLPV